MHRRLVLAGLAAGAASLAGCQSVLRSRESRTTEATFEVPADTPLAVALDNGSVGLDPYDGDGLDVTATISGPSQEAIEGVEVVAVENDGELLLTRQVREAAATASVSVGLDVRYPRGLPLTRVETDNGSFDAAVTAITDEARLQTDNGSLQVALSPTLDATVEATTDNGSLTVEGFDFEVDETAGTASGTIGDGSKRLTLRTDNGSLSITEFTD